MAFVQLSATNVMENATSGTVIGTLSVFGGKNNETFTYTLADNLSDRFEIRFNETTKQYELVVKNGGNVQFDYDPLLQQDFDITISATSTDTNSPTAVDTKEFKINIIDNVAPTDIALSKASVLEHAGAGTVVGTLSATDANENDTLTFTLVNDAEGRFDLQNGRIVVKDGSKLDWLSAASHQIQVQVTDADNNTFTEYLTINVADALEYRGGTSRSEKIYGSAAGDAIFARGGSDRVYGNGGNDQIDGGSGNDRLYGHDGNDRINGSSGNDRIYGHDGDDWINGGSSKDIIYGGAGKDTFVFTSTVKRGHYDQIRDFNPVDDTIEIDLSALKTFKVKASFKDLLWSVFTGGNPYKKKYYSLDKVMAEGKLDSDFFSTSYKAKDSNDFFYYNKKNGFVYFDADGSGRTRGIEIAKLQKGLTLTADDFTMI